MTNWVMVLLMALAFACLLGLAVALYIQQSDHIDQHQSPALPNKDNQFNPEGVSAAPQCTPGPPRYTPGPVML